MRENRHSKKLAFAVLAATAAVGVSAVAPVSAATPMHTADGFIFAGVGNQAGQTPDPHNTVDYGFVQLQALQLVKVIALQVLLVLVVLMVTKIQLMVTKRTHLAMVIL